MKKMHLLFLCLALNSLSTFANCLIFERSQLLADNFRDSHIDPVAREKWIEAHSPDYQPAARFLADHIQIISRADYEKAMSEGLSEVLKKIPEEESLFLLVPNHKPGHLWNTRYAQLLQPRLRTAPVVEMKNFGTQLLNLRAQKKIHMLSIDDVSYSGSQLKGELEESLRTIEKLIGDFGELPPVGVHFFRAAGSNAVKKWATQSVSGASAIPEDLTIDFGMTIPTISEIKGAPDQTVLQAFDMWHASPLALPFFKQPDGISFSHKIMQGTTNTGAWHRFIYAPRPGAAEPYRQSPFVGSSLSKPSIIRDERSP